MSGSAQERGARAPFVRVAALRDPGLEAVLWSLVPALSGPAAVPGPFRRAVTPGTATPPVGDAVAQAASAVGRLAARLDGVGPSPALQLDALGERVAGGFDVPGPQGCGLEELRPDRAVRTGRADALVAAALTVAAGQRRGWDVGVVLGRRDVLVGHRALEASLVCSLRHDGHLLEAEDLEDPTLRWACAHEVAAALLGRVAAAAGAAARPDLVLRARELAQALPDASGARDVELARARAAFN